MDADEMINLIKKYSDHHKTFNDEFICSIENAFYEYGDLTCSQLEACEYIIKKFRMINWEKNLDKDFNPNNLPWEEKK